MAVDPDLVIIGAGPGGYVCAVRASQLGLKVAIVEREALGGICLNWGCIPTKALLRTADLFEQAKGLAAFGVRLDAAPSVDLPAVVARSRKVAAQLSSGVAFLMKKNRIEVIEGEARLAPGATAPEVHVRLKAGGERRIAARAVVLATGARARTAPSVGLTPDGERIWTYREALTPKFLPTRLLVIGSGAIGIEFASFYRAIGAEVTVIEALDRILPAEDEEVSAAARKAFERRGIAFRTPARVSALARKGDGVVLTIETAKGGETLEADAAIVAIGIDGNVEDLGLEALGAEIDRGHLKADLDGRTRVAGLFAIGDVAGPPWLAHKASHDGVRCAEAIAGQPGAHLPAPIPGCTYAHPQIASVGLTEAQARERGLETKVGRFPFRANGKAIAAGETDGFVKTVFDAKTGALVGAHMIGAEVTEMIQGFALAITLEATEADIFATVFPHPTMSESMHEASLDAFGLALNI